MKMNPYLLFNGNCEAALTFYQKCLGGKIQDMMHFEGSPAEQQVPAEWRKKVLHAMFVFNGNVLMASDAPPGHFQAPQGFSVSVSVDEPAEAQRVFDALAQNGKVTMPMEKTFWSVRFGMLVDQYGIPWMVNCSQPL